MDTQPLTANKKHRYARKSVVEHLTRWRGATHFAGDKVLDRMELLELQALAKKGYDVEVEPWLEMTYDEFVDEVMRLLESS